MPGGYTVVTSVNNWTSGNDESMCFVLDPSRKLVHFWPVSTRGAHSAQPTTGWDALITDFSRNRIIEVAPDGRILWDSDTVVPLSDGTRIEFPNDAKVLANGNILFSELGKHRCVEIDRVGNVVWKYPPLRSNPLMNHPHNPNRLANGNTLIADSGNNRIIEVDPAGQVVWSYAPTGAAVMNSPRDVDPMPNGDVLIADSFNGRLLVVDRMGVVQATVPTRSWVYDVDLLSSGNFLISGSVLREIDPAGNVVWEYPPPAPTLVRELFVQNPTTGVNLSYTVYVPVDAGPANRRPAVVFVPDRLDPGAPFIDACRYFAAQGFVAVRFDPDGRGVSTNGGTYTIEDYGGHRQQDGLRTVLQAVAARAEVDASRLVVASYGYGVTMAAGCLARYPGSPAVALLRDFEGPATRAETAAASGGFVPVVPTDDVFWGEREALSFMPQVDAIYVRRQTAVDHEPGTHPQNFHAIDLNAAAVETAFGGGGGAPMAQVNGHWMNSSDVVWTLARQPVWVDESIDNQTHDFVALHATLDRMLWLPQISLAAPAVIGSSARLDLDAGTARAGGAYFLLLSLGVPPLPPASAVVLTIGALDASGRGGITLPVPSDPALRGLPLFAWGGIALPAAPTPFVLAPYLPFTIQ